MSVMVPAEALGGLPPAHGAYGEGNDIMSTVYDPSLFRELDELPTLSEGQADDLKIDTAELTVGFGDTTCDAIRVWISRVERGVVEAERYVGGVWLPGGEDDILAAVAVARLDGLL